MLIDYRSTPHATTGISPFEVMFGRKMMNPLRALSPDKYFKGEEKEIIDREMVEAKQKTMKERHEAKHTPRGPEIQKGD